MRCAPLFVLLGSAAAFGQTTISQNGCPAFSFSSASSAALASSASTHRVLIKQGDGSYTAFEIENASAYSVVRSIPHFETQVRPCVPGFTGLNSFPVLAASQTNTGGYIFATPRAVSDFDVEADITVFDSGLNLIGQTTVGSAANVLFADVNGDGILDCIASGPSNQFSVSLGKGGATFQPAITGSIPAEVIVSVAVADLNGDHKPDLVIAGTSLRTPTKGVWTLLGNGDGTFQPPKIIAQSQPSVIAIADLNGDGKPDLVFTAGGVQVALGAGDGTFATPVLYATGGGTASIAIGDLNGDGIPDIVTSGATILFGDGKGAFPSRRDVFLEPQTFQVGEYDFPQGTLFITDFNGDGIPDIVQATGNATGNFTGPRTDPSVFAGDTVTVLFGLGAGEFTGPPVIPVPDLPALSFHQLTAIASADLNGDGIPDFVAADKSGYIAVLKGKGDGIFQPSDSFTVAVGSVSQIVFSDFNNDGSLDFALAGTTASAGAVEIVLGKGDGTFQAPIGIPAPLGTLALAVGDFNGDRHPDLAVVVSPASFSPSAAVPIPDVVQIWPGNGTGSFVQGAVYPLSSYTTSIAAGDFNGDGKPDLLVPGTGNLVLLTGNGDGTFAAPVAVPVPASPANYPASTPVIADFNRDGKLDVAVSLVSLVDDYSGLAILLGRGDGTFQPAVTYAASAGTMFASDLNGDGILDLVTSGTRGSVRYLLGNGDGSFQPPVAVSAGADTLDTAVAVADFNHDGKLDVAAGATAGIAVFLNDSQPLSAVTIVSAASLAPGPLAPDSIATAFGTDLPSNPSLSVTDSAGTTESASVIYSSPSQINFVIPSGLDPGPATVTIGSLSVPVVLAPLAPSLFTANTQGFAAAYVTSISPDGTAMNQPIYSYQNGVVTPIPVDISAGPAYLIVFGTGLRNYGTAQILMNTGNWPVLYAGPQPSFPGLDQVNIRLPQGPNGSGVMRLDLTVGGLPANPVFITLK